MNDLLNEVIHRHAQSLDPIPTGEKPVLCKLPAIRAVLFDIYGTLLISASGDIDASDSASKGLAFGEALSAINIDYDGEAGAQLLMDAIYQAHEQARRNG